MSEEEDTAEVEPHTRGKKLSKGTVAEIRALRAEVDDEGAVVHTHAALGERFGISAGTVSGIVRNRSYHDPDYSPTNDGLFEPS